MSDCQVCHAKSQLFLCHNHADELRMMLRGLVVGELLPNGRRAPGWLEYLEDAALGNTRLGESARRSSDRTTPLPFGESASDLLDSVGNTLGGWVRHLCESRGMEVIAQEGMS